jgi:hypothetical protein
MSNGTFNLTEFYRQLGIKNPEPGVRETVQPVLIVGDLSGLTPRHVPPTFIGGGALTDVAGEYTIYQFTSRSPGGSVILSLMCSSFCRVGIAAPTAGLAVLPDRGPLSNEASTVLAEFGHDAADPMAGDHPLLRCANFHSFAKGWFVPPGRTLVFSPPVVEYAVDNFAIVIEDIPAAEIPPE